MSNAAMRACVVGAGPAGFYATAHLLEAGFAVDLLDALPTPFGLVRAGVAPDHPKIKSVTRVYEKTAARPGFRFFGGVALGRHVSREDLLARYHAVVYAIGTPSANRLGIPGEDRPGSYAATDFVAWYNGHPDACDREFDLSARRAVVIGNGNVALDVTRMLVLPPDALASTDIANHALRELTAASVEEVVVLGRRGPAQAAFTDPELRELGALPGVDAVVDPAALPEDAGTADAATRRRLEILRRYAARRAEATRRIELRFLRSPVEILGEGEDGPVTAVRVAVNRLGDGDRAVPTGEHETIECGLVLRCIGYRGLPIAGLPFDERRGLIRNDGARVCDVSGRPCRGEYVAGWIGRGPSGVIGTNKKDAADTVAAVVADAAAGALNAPGTEPTERWLAGRTSRLVTWAGWQTIDEHERRRGTWHGRPRVKIVRHDQLYAAARGQ